MSLDFSNRSELRPLADLARSLQAVASPLRIELFLMGAAARDLMMTHAHGFQASRLTEDVDFAVMVQSWGDYEKLHSGLIASGEFVARPGPAMHRLKHVRGLPLDIVPFGGVERPDRKIEWPAERGVTFDCFGVKEAFDASIRVRLPLDVELRVASIPALAILKTCAWHDRRRTHPGRDAPDLLLFARSYMDCGNLDRAASQHADLFDTEGFDHTEAGARLLARDMAAIISAAGRERLLAILRPEADVEGPLLLAHQSAMDMERARRLLKAMCEELATR